MTIRRKVRWFFYVKNYAEQIFLIKEIILCTLIFRWLFGQTERCSKKSYTNERFVYIFLFQALTKSSKIVASLHNTSHFKKVDNLSWMLIIVSIVFTVCQVCIVSSDTFDWQWNIFTEITFFQSETGYRRPIALNLNGHLLRLSFLWSIGQSWTFSPTFNNLNIFGLLQVPVLVSSVIKTIDVALNYDNEILNKIHDYLVVLVNMLMSVNSATNFIIYVVCGTEFRKTLKDLIQLR